MPTYEGSQHPAFVVGAGVDRNNAWDLVVRLAVLYQIVDDPELAAWAPGGTALVASLDLAIADLLARPAIPTRRASAGRGAPVRIPLLKTISVKYLMQTLAEARPIDSVIVEEAPSSRPAMHCGSGEIVDRVQSRQAIHSETTC